MSRPLVITGPTGWIGRALLARLAADGGLDRVRLFGSAEGMMPLAAGRSLPIRAIAGIGGADVEGAEIVHLAYLTKEKAALLGEPAFTAGNRAIDAALLRACADARPHAIFVASSGAAMLAETGQDPHPYGLAKLAQERAFLDHGRATGVAVTAARIFNLAGPHINKVESYAIASFASQALSAGRIRIAASQPAYRAYLHVDDLARLMLAALDRGIGAPGPIDFCGSEIVEMGEIARAVAAVNGLGESAIERPALTFGAGGAYLGDPVAMRTLALRLGIALAGFGTQVRDTVAYLARDEIAA